MHPVIAVWPLIKIHISWQPYSHGVLSMTQSSLLASAGTSLYSEWWPHRARLPVAGWQTLNYLIHWTQEVYWVRTCEIIWVLGLIDVCWLWIAYCLAESLAKSLAVLEMYCMSEVNTFSRIVSPWGWVAMAPVSLCLGHWAGAGNAWEKFRFGLRNLSLVVVGCVCAVCHGHRSVVNSNLHPDTFDSMRQ